LGGPSTDELIEHAKDYYYTYGLLVVLIAAFIEGIVAINILFPGTAILALGVVFSGETGMLNIIPVLGVVLFAYFVTSILNYAFGKYGWHQVLLHYGLEQVLRNETARVQIKGVKRIYATYFNPQIGAIVAVSCGTLNMRFRTFAINSLIALILWQTLLGVLIYFIGLSALKTVLDVKILFLAVLIYSIVRFLKGRRDRKSELQTF
jgi:membrane protein DedA with SNARE-associated domain